MLLPVLLIAASKLMLYLLFAGRYGYFRDELYYIACSRHLDWGYVDQPPLIALVTWLELHIFGSSLHSLRLFPALAGAGLIVLAAKIAKEMGAGRFGQWFAALATACIGVEFVMNYLLTMNGFEPLFWMGCAYIVVRVIDTGNQKLWLWFGAVAGLGLQNKYSMAFFGAGIVVGLLLTPERKGLAQRWIWIAGAIAFAIFLPNAIWNIRHGWPFLELMANIRASGRDVAVSPLDFVMQQILVAGPPLLPVWLIGLYSLMFGSLRRYRALGWAYLATFVFLMSQQAKNYYLAPAYAMLMAAGAVAIERFIESRDWQWIKPVAATAIVVITALTLPLVLPVMPVESQIAYLSRLPLGIPAAEKSHLGAALPQHFADQFGWEEMTAAVDRVYRALPAADRARACIGARNYGEAGAIDFFGPKYGLPHAISGHQNYFLWGPGNCTGQVLILLGDSKENIDGRCSRVDVGAQLYHPYAILFENKPVLVCRGLNENLQQIWPKLKDWD